MTDLDEAYELSEQAEKEKHDAKVKQLEKENVELIGKVAFLENDLNNAKAQIEKMKSDVELARDNANETENWETFSVLNSILDDWEIKEK